VPKTLGPNTEAPPSVLHESCLYCAGEDRRELLEALAETGPPDARQIAQVHLGLGRPESRDDSEPATHWYYRSYEFWRFRDFCLILSGIGTGCLEPLLYEVLRVNVVRRIVLIGTAGSMPGSKAALGQAYAIDRAWPAGTGIDGEVSELPLRPRWAIRETMQTSSSVSSDFFYGFAPAILEGKYPIDHGRLKVLFEEHLKRGTELVEMEIAQFYLFCRNFGGNDLQYLAIKGVSNAVGSEAQQSVNSLAAVASSLAGAFRALGIAANRDV
jgi:nucleoside phosphorylase